jgi:tetratricopeptide (TPR) repeat protein
LNEPREAESICRDVLEVEPDNQEALAKLLLSLSDQFGHGLSGRYREAKKLVSRLASEYEREYYTGILFERRAKCQLHQGTPGCGHLAYEGFTKAMEHYERAQELSPEGIDDAVLRWNTCARIINANHDIVPEPAGHSQPVQLE